MIIVSKCLLGFDCKYNGGNNYNQEVVDFLKNKEYMLVCPEQAGGLPTPRIPCECLGDKVINKSGEDKTKEFIQGAKACLTLIKDKPIEFALLKAKSPSCGVGKTYDGSFSGRLIEGDGIFARELLNLGIPVYHEGQLTEIKVE